MPEHCLVLQYRHDRVSAWDTWKFVIATQLINGGDYLKFYFKCFFFVIYMSTLTIKMSKGWDPDTT